MTNQHPITPPRELVEQWTALANEEEGCKVWHAIATQAARWGADQELEAMLAELKALHLPDGYAARLRDARRPKLPSLKRVALLQLDTLNADLGLEGKGVDLSQIRRALEALDD